MLIEEPPSRGVPKQTRSEFRAAMRKLVQEKGRTNGNNLPPVQIKEGVWNPKEGNTTNLVM